MKPVFPAAFVSLALASGVGIAQAATPAGEAAARSAPAAVRGALTVGVIDPMKILEVYPRAIAERKRLDEYTKQRTTQLQAEQRKVKELEAQIADFNRGTVDRDLHELAYLQARQNVDGLQKVFESEIGRKLDEYRVAMLEDVQLAVAEVAKERGVDLVLRAYADRPDGSLDTKARLFDARVVWFATDSIDLTTAVIQRLQTFKRDEPADGAAGKKPVAPKEPAKDQSKESTGQKP